MNGGPHDPILPEERAEPVVVVPYDPAWEGTFRRIRERVVAALGDLVVGVEHVGSTAVPGLAAKPIVDVDVIVRRVEDVPQSIRALAAIGYAHLGDLGIAGREAFRAPADLPRHHLYLCAVATPELRAHLTFRDALRADPALAQRYADLKRALAERHRDDRDAYTEGKSAFIRSVLRNEKRDRRSRR